MTSTAVQASLPSSDTSIDGESGDTQTLGDGVEPTDAIARVGRIIVGVDGSASSIAALQQAVHLANATDASVVAICTWRMPTAYGAMGTFEHSPEDDAKSILAAATKSTFVGKAPGWFSSVTFEGGPVEVLTEQSHGASMLVVGSRGHGGLAGVLLGSVSAFCAERASCPVLIIH